MSAGSGRLYVDYTVGRAGPAIDIPAMTLSSQLALASLIVAAMVLFHLTGLAALLALLRRHRRARSAARDMAVSVMVVMTVAFGLFALHTIEIWGWAAVYRVLAIFTGWEEALYFSTTTYVTIGYGDVVLPHGSRILGAIEGANGIILLGWSTAFFFNIVDRMKLLERQLEDDVQRSRA